MKAQAGFSDCSGPDHVVDIDAPILKKVLARTSYKESTLDVTADEAAVAVWIARLIQESGEDGPSDADKIRGAWLVTDHARGWT